MTHPLSEELRKLAVSGIALGGTKDTLRRAADALDELQDKADTPSVEAAMRFFHSETGRLEAEQRAERAEAHVRELKDKNEAWIKTAAEKQAQAARYRAALEHIEGICPRDWLPWITKALCEPETGGET